jgi:D-tyrosyl-tRNA(Tyr) deacylase
MRAVIQRVSEASVTVEGNLISKIGPGILALAAVSTSDTLKDIKWMADKICGIRIFSDSEDRMNLDLAHAGGKILVVSQFTLYGDCRKGKRPSYSNSAKADFAEKMYLELINEIRSKGVDVKTGVFGAMMKVNLINDGPVTLILDSQST